MLSKIHFSNVACILNDYLKAKWLEQGDKLNDSDGQLLERFCSYFKNENKDFDRDKFIAFCVKDLK